MSTVIKMKYENMKKKMKTLLLISGIILEEYNQLLYSKNNGTC